MIVTTSSNIPGYQITQVMGLVVGHLVYAPSASLRSMFKATKASFGGGGDFSEYLKESQDLVQERMVEKARSKGANAVISMRFSMSVTGGGIAILAYGTAVKAEKAN